MADILSYDELLKEFRKLAKRADQRLIRLEQEGKTGVGSYRSAMRSISQFKAGGTRFNIKVPKDMRALRARYSAVETFLGQETSTKTGRKALASRVRAKIKENYGLDIKSDAELEAIFEGGLWSDLNARFQGSDTTIKILATVQQSDGDIKDAILNMRDKYYVSEEEAKDAADIVNAWLQDKNLGKIFGR